MPQTRGPDPARNGDRWSDHMKIGAVLPGTSRLGKLSEVADLDRPYTYRGSDHSPIPHLPAIPPTPRATTRRAPAPSALLDLCEAIDGPGWEWYREARQEAS